MCHHVRHVRTPGYLDALQGVLANGVLNPKVLDFNVFHTASTLPRHNPFGRTGIYIHRDRLDVKPQIRQWKCFGGSPRHGIQLCLARAECSRPLRPAAALFRCFPTQWDADKNLLTVSLPIVHDFDAKLATSSANELD